MKHFRQLFLYALLCTVTGLSTKCTFGQPFSLVKDINTTQSTFSSSPANFITIGNTLYFTATTNTNGNELWKSDGTTAGTVLVKDIRSGIAGSFPENLTNVNGTLFFQAFDDTYGEELWKSDGTTAGTVLVKDIRSGLQSSTPVYLTNFNGTLFFAAFDNTNGQELWKSDGTTAGTVLVKDINSGPNSSNPFYLTNVNGTLFFTAINSDNINDRELWKSDGTTAGTVLIKDIISGSAGSNPLNLTNVNGTLFFAATDVTNGQELWKSDGTANGTVLVKDIRSGSNSSSPNNLTNVNGTLFFAANDATNGRELWKSDGTMAGTVLVKDINSGSASSFAVNLTNVNGTLFFRADDGINGEELWKSDGTTAGTVLVKDIRSGSASSSPVNLTNVNGTLFFVAFDATNGNELWKSDGTTGGTVLVKDINIGPNSSSPGNLTNVNGTLFFAATDATNGTELWKSDGTTAGTVLVKDINIGSGNSSPGNLTNVNGTLFFAATDATNGTELWKSDGTTAGTVLVKDINSGSGNSSPANLTNVNGTLFFTAFDNNNGTELWKSDGTTAGTVLVKDIISGLNSSSPGNLTNINSTLFFTAFDFTNGIELWKSDGTMAGTVLVKDIRSGSVGSSPGSLTNVNGTLFFTATDATNGTELWKSDGTTAGTVLVKDINTGSNSSSLGSLTNVNGTLFFAAFDNTNGQELWKSDGTAAGTVLVKDIISGGAGSNPVNLTNVNGTLFFTAVDATSGRELWKSDGTTAGTVLVKDIISGSASSGPVNLTNVNGTLFFIGFDNTNGQELWKSDGTTAGTVLVRDIRSGSAGSFPENLTNFNGTVFFTAFDDTNGRELWKSNGTANGTVLVQDIISGSRDGQPQQLTLTGTYLFLVITDDAYGQELWGGSVAQPGLSIDDVVKVEGNAGTSTFSFTVSLSAPSSQNVSFGIATIDGSATAGSDYVARAGSTQTISAGSTTYTFDVTVNGDVLFEGDEIFMVTLFNPVNATITDNVGWCTINDDDPQPGLSIDNVMKTEGNAGTSTFSFTVSLSAVSGLPAIFQIATADGTAMAGSDYVARTVSTQTISAGSTTYTFDVTVNGDVLFEGNETFMVNLFNPINATITDNQGVCTINNDDAQPGLSVDNVIKAEGDAGTSTFSFTVSLSAVSGLPATFQIATADGTAMSGSDYVARPISTQSISAGSTTYTFDVTVNGDNTFEVPEIFLVNITNATNAVITNGTGIGTITNDDPLPNLTIKDVTQVEGNSATSAFIFTVNLSSPAPAGGVTFDIATANNTAVAPADYTAKSLTAQTIPAGSSTYSFTVLVNGDVTFEPNESFFVNITNATNAVITDGQGVGTITNDDADPCATDVTSPVITPKMNATVFLNANGQVTVLPSDVATVTDNCTLQSVTVSPNSFSCANITASNTYQPFVAINATGNQNATGEQGMDFRVNATNGIVITQLGAFDHQANGLIGTQPDGNGGFGIRVAIFNKANQSIVSGLDVVITGNGDAFSGNYRYKNIPAVTLPPGDYVVLAKGYNANELNGNSYLGGGPYPQGDNAGGAITYLNTAYYDENDAVPGFTYPSVSVNTGTSSVLKSGTFTYALSQNNVVTVTAKDVAGNQSQVNVNVLVVDTMYVLATKNITVNLNSSGQASIQPKDVLQSYKNKCGIDVISSTLQVSPSNFTCADVGAATLSSPHQPFIAINATGNQNAAGEQGMDFRVNATNGIVITQLGAFDHQANGLMGTQPDGNGGFGIRVAIFNKANQSIVSGLDVVITGNGDAFSGNYRYKNIPAVTLPPGDYVVLAKGYNANELSGNSYLGGGPYPQGDNASGAITYLNTAYYDENDAVPGFTYPSVSVNTGTSSVLKSGTFTYKTKMATGTLVTLTATDVYGNQKQATANVTVTDFNHVCTPAAKAAPVMAAAISTKQPKELVEVEKVSAYPNPSNGVFNVLLSGYSVPKLSLEILDGNGKVVAVKAVTLSSKTQTQTVPFDLGNRASGMYWIRVVSASGVQTTKAMVQR